MAYKPSKLQKHLFEWILVFSTYFVTGKIGLSLNAVSGFATLIWAPTGIALAAVLISGNRILPAIFVASFMVNDITGAPHLTSFFIALGNTFEAFMGGFLLIRVWKFKNNLSRIQDVLALFIFGGFISTLFSATIGVFTLYLGGMIKPMAIETTWMTWWTGDLVGDLVVAPLILAWRISPKEIIRAPVKRYVEAFTLGVFTILLSLFAFILPLGHPLGADMSNVFLSFMIFVLLFCSAFRFEQRGATAISAVVCLISVWGAVNGYGAFYKHDLNQNLFHTAAFITLISTTTLILSVLVFQKNKSVSENSRLLKEVKEALQIREDFLSIASHELRTPLTSLSMQLQLIERMLKKSDHSQKTEAEAEKLLEKIVTSEKQAKQLGYLIDILLDVSKLAGRKLSIEKTKANLNTLLKDVTCSFNEEVLRRGSSLIINDAEQIDAPVDVVRVTQAVTNLLSNAIKYGQGKPVEISLKRAGEMAQIIVKDQGMGIAKKDQKRVFDRFERAVPFRSISGMGLGLYITREIIRAHGGSISLESEAGKGSVFILNLPLAENRLLTAELV